MEGERRCLQRDQAHTCIKHCTCVSMSNSSHVLRLCYLCACVTCVLVCACVTCVLVLPVCLSYLCACVTCVLVLPDLCACLTCVLVLPDLCACVTCVLVCKAM